MWNDEIVTSEKYSHSNVNLQARIKDLLIKLSVENPNTPEFFEMEELVSRLVIEANEQKYKLVVLHERQEGMIKMLKQKLKLTS